MYDENYYHTINQEEGEPAYRLGKLLTWIYKPKSVLDVGSATGLYLKPFYDAGIKITGVDLSVSAVTERVLQVPKKFIKIQDITKKKIGIKADLTICIEVLEHIPESDAQISIKHISETSDTIFFTAAQPGQGGVGHINCQPKEYWEKLFTPLGFRRDQDDEEYIKIVMQSGPYMIWMINNLMVFKRDIK